MENKNKKLNFDLEFLGKGQEKPPTSKSSESARQSQTREAEKREEESSKEPNKEASGTERVVGVRPWVRYWARYIDIVIFSIAFGFLLGFLMPSVFDSMSDFVFGLLLLFVWIFVEAGLLSTWGTTPGKWLLKVQLKDVRGGMPEFSTALNRSFAVWFRGLGVGIPIIALFTMIAAYNRLTKQGATSWDEDGHFTITHGKVGVIRTLVAIGIFSMFIFLIALGYE